MLGSQSGQLLDEDPARTAECQADISGALDRHRGGSSPSWPWRTLRPRVEQEGKRIPSWKLSSRPAGVGKRPDREAGTEASARCRGSVTQLGPPAAGSRGLSMQRAR
jgi:hypothetical protein